MPIHIVVLVGGVARRYGRPLVADRGFSTLKTVHRHPERKLTRSMTFRATGPRQMRRSTQAVGPNRSMAPTHREQVWPASHVDVLET
jgi:hypothetical protein